MKLSADRVGFYRFWCLLYIGIGLCSLAAGVWVLVIIRQMGREAPEGLGFIAFILILFGPLRIANSAWVLNSMRKRSR
jgi:hypothetical protein